MITATITFKVKTDEAVEAIEKIVEQIGEIVDLSVEYSVDRKRIENSIQCRNCLTLVEPKTYSVPFKSGEGFHMRADCPKCGKFIKFVKQ